MLNIQKFIIQNGLEAAIAQFKLRVNETEHYIQLNYDQIESPKCPETNECRGLVLDRHNWRVAAQSFYRFFNENEGHADTVCLDRAVLQEKLDGTLITLWFDQYDQKWVVSTRGRIFADGGVGGSTRKLFGGNAPTFSELFMEVIRDNYPEFWDKLKTIANEAVPFLDFKNTGNCLIFELFGPENRILTQYETSNIRLLGGRDLSGTVELSGTVLDTIANHLGVSRPRTYSFNNYEDIIKIFEELDPTDEGFVLVDYSILNSGNFPRVKIKNPRYLALSRALHAGEGEFMDSKTIVNLIRIGEVDEVLAYFPEFTDKITAMKNRFDLLGTQIDRDFAEIKGIENRKDFALIAKECLIPNALFALKDDKVKTGEEYLRNMREENLLELLKK